MTATKGIYATVEELLCYQHSVIKKMPAKKSNAQQAGQQLSSFRGRGMDFSEVRDYQTGDDIRQMEWRVTARTGKPHIKLYHEEKERPIFIVTDFNPSMFFGSRVAYKSVIAARFSAMLGFAASHNGDKVGGIIFSGDDFKDIRPKARKQGVLPLIEQLSQFSLTPSIKQRPLDAILMQLRNVVKPGALIFILSDFECLGELINAHLQRLSLRADLICALISDPLERKAPQPGRYGITNGTDDSLIDTSSKAMQDNYEKHYQNKYQWLKGLIKPGALLEISTDDDLETHLQRAFSSLYARRQ